MAGFAGARHPQPPGGRTGMPADRKYPPIVSRRMCTAASMRRSDHPNRPKAMTCSLLSWLKTLLTLTQATPDVWINVLNQFLLLAAFQPIIFGRFWVIPEVRTIEHRRHKPEIDWNELAMKRNLLF